MKFNWLDAGVAAFLILGVIGGGNKGLWRSLGRIAGVGLALWAAVVWRQPALTYLENNYAVVSLLAQAWQKQMTAPAFEGSARTTTEIFPFVLYPSQNMIYSTVKTLVGAALFLLLFFLVSIAARVLWELLYLLLCRGVLKKADRIGGGILGGVEAIIIMSILLGVAWSVLGSLTQSQIKNAALARAYIDSSFSFPWLKEVFDLMGKIIKRPWL